MRNWIHAPALVVAGIALLSGAAKAGDTYIISPAVWGLYQEYLGKIDNGNKPGAYVITKDGYGAYYVWCDANRCRAGATYSQAALDDCEREYDTECVTFAVRDNIRVAYEVARKEPSASVAPDLSPPPPATRIVVSAAVKADIDAYLSNAKRAGRASALAIAQDGSEVAAASCPTSSSYSGGRACDPVKGAAQELASREAVMRCGGAAACVLLYEGAQPTGKIEIVTQ